MEATYYVRLETKSIAGRPVCRYETVSAGDIIDAWLEARRLASDLNLRGGEYVVGAVGIRSCYLKRGITEATNV